MLNQFSSFFKNFDQIDTLFHQGVCSTGICELCAQSFHELPPWQSLQLVLLGLWCLCIRLIYCLTFWLFVCSGVMLCHVFFPYFSAGCNWDGHLVVVKYPRWHEMNVMPTAYINGFTFWVLKPIEATTWLQYFAMKEALRLAGLSMTQSVGCRLKFQQLFHASVQMVGQCFFAATGAVVIGAKWRSQRPETNIAFVGASRLPSSGRVFQLHTTDSDSSSCEHNILHLWFKKNSNKYVPCDWWKSNEGLFECFASCVVLEFHGSSDLWMFKQILGISLWVSDFCSKVTFPPVAKNARLEWLVKALLGPPLLLFILHSLLPCAGQHVGHPPQKWLWYRWLAAEKSLNRAVLPHIYHHGPTRTLQESSPRKFSGLRNDR